MTRDFQFRIITVVGLVVVLELACWIFATSAERFGILHFYPSDIFARVTDDRLARDSQVSPLGWPSDDSPRPAASEPGTICGSAFGDSFTYGGEVEAEEAWVHLISRRLGCKIENYGVGGYGIDQAVLRYERVATGGNVVILGAFVEMLRRAVAASGTFYASSPRPFYTNIKPYFTLEAGGLRLHPIPKPLTRESIAAHHAHDYYMHEIWTGSKFPCAFQVAHAGYIRVARRNDYHLLSDGYWSVSHPSGSGLLARRLIDRLAQTARERNGRLV